jgi:hypothetical protein
MHITVYVSSQPPIHHASLQSRAQIESYLLRSGSTCADNVCRTAHSGAGRTAPGRHADSYLGAAPASQAQIGGRKPTTVDSHEVHPESRLASRTGFSASAIQPHEIIDSPTIIAASGGQISGHPGSGSRVRTPAQGQQPTHTATTRPRPQPRVPFWRHGLRDRIGIMVRQCGRAGGTARTQCGLGARAGPD